MTVEIAGRRLESELPGTQGRLLFAYLTANRFRPVARGELISVLWPERAGRALIALEPYRESGYRVLMRALEARGNVAAALAVYDELRCRLREELGAAPGAVTQALHKQLLTV